MIDKLAWIYTKNNKMLFVLSKGKDKYYVPGGKRKLGETDEQALIREIKEEVSVTLLKGTIKHLGTFEAQADGKPEGVMVRTTCYIADFTGELKPDSEIEKLSWIGYDEYETLTPVAKLIFNELYKQGLLK